MLPHIFDRISFLSLFLAIVLLPVFFLPFTGISVETSKGLLLVVGLVVSIVFWIMARFSDGKIVLPKSLFLLSGFGVVIAFFLSALFSSARGASFFGTMFDVGTFWFIFALFLLMLFFSILLKDPKKAVMVLFGVIISSAVVLVFQSLHLFFPEALSFGVLTTKTSNLLGSWNALGIFAGFFSFISLFMIEFFSIPKISKFFVSIFLILSLLIIVVTNSVISWEILGIFSLIVFVYKISFSLSENKEQEKNIHFPFIPFILMMLSLLFFMQSPYVATTISNRLGVSNLEVSPTFLSTMVVTKASLLKDPVFGIGPNRFGDIWSMYKPSGVNKSEFWDTRFDFGSGLLPTLASTTGIIGILSLLFFFFFFLKTGIKSIFSGIKNGMNQTMSIFFVASLYLFVASFLYPTGPVIIILAFAFAGIFIGLLNANVSGGELTILFSDNPKKSFFTLLLLVFTMVAFCVAGFKYLERLASVSYFSRALSAKTIEEALPAIRKANQLYPNDLYLRVYSQVYLSKLNSSFSEESSLSEADKANLQLNLDQAVNSAQLATLFNKDNYQNFATLGSVYGFLSSFGVKGAYDKALEAYGQASILNPLNPSLKLSIARVFLTNDKIKDAKDNANAALSLKPDYTDAFLVLSQIAKGEGNNPLAISYGEKALSLFPQDKNLIQYVDSLKNTNTPSASNTSKENKNTQ